MDSVYGNIKQEKEVLLVYMQRLVPGRSFEAIGNLGTMTLAACLNRAGYRAKSLTGITTDIRKILHNKRDSLLAVCFYCDFDNQSAIKSLLLLLADEPYYKLVGGPQTMHMDTKDFNAFCADAILCGDGEESLVKWLDQHLLLNKRTYSDESSRELSGKPHGGNSDGIIEVLSEGLPEDLSKGLSKEFIEELEVLPEEITENQKGRYTLLTDFSPYPFADDNDNLSLKTSVFSVITARGCPHRCSFCFEGGNSKLLRPRPVREVLAEIETRLEKSPYLNYLFFADDTFTYEIGRLREFNEGLKEIRKNHDFVWFCEGHASFFKKHPEALADMVDAGMVRMQIGMESGNDEILKAYGKGIKAEDIRYTARLAYDAGLPQLAGNFIIGGAFESNETLTETREFMLSLMEEFPGLLDISTTFPIPLPGTKMLIEPEAYGIIWDYPEYDCSIEDVPVNHTIYLSPEEISLGRQKFVAAMHGKMKNLCQRGLISPEQIRKKQELQKKYGILDNWGRVISNQSESRSFF